uniref:Helicase ATP-binding domain-containing protein n=1 Tax=Chromera velia CCMP2878 TaxID=1169474 RepID=A0A0G4FU31_9ALVE|eukprot:Cvel_18777.t1-p1 / transcript=Cvel_18777.t1 / gene=Cvel_18777 / organism=Chromera_velia_CCMP2878 / gene_product=Probable helicase MAGATAMA 3, putative / transcript_product=Probable helicase MAGATAMA 3, putative / location=Cvel_scaffold1576:10291-13230(+) / protein_length=857 / sequence_SO=supercontig / SO=protein_coding / is_pseudo=false
MQAPPDPPPPRPFGEDPVSSDLDLVGFFLQHVEALDVPWQLPVNTLRFQSLLEFVSTEMKVQLEILRSEANDLALKRQYPPREVGAAGVSKDEKCAFVATGAFGQREDRLCAHLNHVERRPQRGAWANYLVVLQKADPLAGPDDVLEHVSVGFSLRCNRDGGFTIQFGSQAEAKRVEEVGRSTRLLVRPLMQCQFRKATFEALRALCQASVRSALESGPTQGLLRGDEKMWAKETDVETSAESMDQSGGFSFNKQQRRALALAKHSNIALIQGPPGTGKSHVITHGMLPQAVLERGERVLVVCNTNRAVDALILKTVRAKPEMRQMILRCGFEDHVHSEVKALEVYAQNSNTLDALGGGGSTDTSDGGVQGQIRSKKLCFTTIHFASKEKEGGGGPSGYWSFDTLVIDEAAQIEDCKLFIVLRCPSLKKIILVGDPQQLQPYVPDEVREKGFGISSMERLMKLGIQSESHRQAQQAPSSSSSSSSQSGGRGGGLAPIRVPFVMLEEQWRMPPLLRALVSRLYYGNRLSDSEGVRAHGPSRRGEEPSSSSSSSSSSSASAQAGVAPFRWKPLVVLHFPHGRCDFSPLQRSFSNELEANLVKQVYDFVIAHLADHVGAEDLSGREEEETCVLTPYNRHKDLLRMKIADIPEENLEDYQTFSADTRRPSVSVSLSASPPQGRGASSSLPLSTPPRGSSRASMSPPFSRTSASHVSAAGVDKATIVQNIDTVDKFQGAERAAVVVSACVDKKPLRASDPHFINVACSRAKHMLFVVGNFTALNQCEDWKAVYTHAKSMGVFLEVDLQSVRTGRVSQLLEEKLLTVSPASQAHSRQPGALSTSGGGEEPPKSPRKKKQRTSP